MRFGFHARQIDGIKCGLFSNHAPLVQKYLYSVLKKVEIRVTVSVTVLRSVIVLCGMMMKGREKVKPSAGS